MAIIVAILGSSGDGKTTSTIINPDGSYNMTDYKGMDPKSHYIINVDGKALPFKAGMWSKDNNNYFVPPPGDFTSIRDCLKWVSGQQNIKSISIDTINILLSMKEYNDRKKLSYDQWKEISNDIIELNSLCNTFLRSDQIVYIMGHTMLQSQPDGSEKMVFSVIGKKLTKVTPESFYPIVLMTRVEYGDNGKNKFYFQTQANHSSAKSPLGMFNQFEIPNSLRLVDDTIREYYAI